MLNIKRCHLRNLIFFTECRDGFYGKSCVHQCSENCYVTRRCDKITGKCFKGCKPGWRTDTCDQSKSIFVRFSYALLFSINCFIFFLLFSSGSSEVSSFTKHYYVHNNKNIAKNMKTCSSSSFSCGIN